MKMRDPHPYLQPLLEVLESPYRVVRPLGNDDHVIGLSRDSVVEGPMTWYVVYRPLSEVQLITTFHDKIHRITEADGVLRYESVDVVKGVPKVSEGAPGDFELGADVPTLSAATLSEKVIALEDLVYRLSEKIVALERELDDSRRDPNW